MKLKFKKIITSVSLLLVIFIIIIACCCIDEQDTHNRSDILTQIHPDTNLSLNNTHLWDESELNISSDTRLYLDEIGTDELTIINIALKDKDVQNLLNKGGMIIGMFVSCPPGPKDDPNPGCFPALRIRYNMKNVDFLVDVNANKVVKTVSNVMDI